VIYNIDIQLSFTGFGQELPHSEGFLSKYVGTTVTMLQYTSLNVCCNIMIIVAKHIDKNPSEDGHSLPKPVKSN
jgi:hypothetical protein